MRRLFQSSVSAIITILVLLLIEYYCFVAVRTATRNLSTPARNTLTGMYILVSVGFWVLLFNFRRFAEGDPAGFLSKYMMAILIGLLLAKVVAALILLFADVYRFFVWSFHALFQNKGVPEGQKAFGISRSRFISQLALLAGAAMVGNLLYGTRNKYNYQVRKIRVKFPNLPEAFNGMKVLHISDIHSGSFDSKEDVERGVRMIMEQDADIILFTGDLVNSLSAEIIPYKEIFAQLRAPMGVFAVLGNHDYGDYHKWTDKSEQVKDVEMLKQHIKDMNWELLMNQHVVFDNRGGRLAIIGIENWSAKSSFPKYGRMDQAVAGLDNKRPDFKILMSHDPSHWDAEVRTKYPDIDLTLSGHTHGMQFGIRLPWMQWSPVQYMYKQWAGLYNEGKQYLYVNPGFGFIGYKGRVGILPEITVLELVNA